MPVVLSREALFYCHHLSSSPLVRPFVWCLFVGAAQSGGLLCSGGLCLSISWRFPACLPACLFVCYVCAYVTFVCLNSMCALCVCACVCFAQTRSFTFCAHRLSLPLSLWALNHFCKLPTNTAQIKSLPVAQPVFTHITVDTTCVHRHMGTQTHGQTDRRRPHTQTPTHIHSSP
mmetsp:Transcript_29846/g.86583  ORF Transcript_29846/g.86583 Transcript_29846/m.86583 type:complete len:174 (-) Transcript_29846:940-1461(-)